MRLSRLHPVFYHVRVFQKRLCRSISDRISGVRFAAEQQASSLPFTCNRHQSLRRVGKTTAAKGYVEGLLLSQGEVRTGVGGGLCQLANLLFWMALHTPLQVTERHHHQFDPFPDDHRVLPFGSGASVFYNYVDLRLFNPTRQTFQIRVWLTDNHLKGAVFTDREWPCAYHVEERNHAFLRQGGKHYRRNEIWRLVIDKRTGNRTGEERVIRNFSEVKYDLADITPNMQKAGQP